MKTFVTAAVVMFFVVVYFFVFQDTGISHPQFPLSPLVYMPAWVGGFIVAGAVVISRKLFFSTDEKFHGLYGGFFLMLIVSIAATYVLRGDFSQTIRGFVIVWAILCFVMCIHFIDITAPQDADHPEAVGTMVVAMTIGMSLVDHRLFFVSLLSEVAYGVYLLRNLPLTQREWFESYKPQTSSRCAHQV